MNIENKRIATIYTLECPIEKTIKYVGCTVSKLRSRMMQHYLNTSRESKKKRDWISMLKEQDKYPVIEAIDFCFEDEKFQHEEYWIGQFKAWGFDLLNMNMGGFTMSENIKRKILQYDLNGNLLYTFNSISEAGVFNNLRVSNISANLNGRSKSAGGCVFKHATAKKENKKSWSATKIYSYNENFDELCFNSIADCMKHHKIYFYSLESCVKANKVKNGTIFSYVKLTNEEVVYMFRDVHKRGNKVKGINEVTGEVILFESKAKTFKYLKIPQRRLNYLISSGEVFNGFKYEKCWS